MTKQFTQYYPSGLPWKYNYGDEPEAQPYKYDGKELVEMHGLDEYDSDARWYYPAIMRTTTPDPLAEKYYDISPYAWCANNPINAFDPDGRDWIMNKEVVNGITIYSFTVNAVLYNNSSDKNIDLDKLAAGLTNQISSIYNINKGDMVVTMDLNLRVVNSVEDIKETDHVFQVVNQESLRNEDKKKVTANADKYGLNINIGTDLARDIISGKNSRSGAHELGIQEGCMMQTLMLKELID
jgi:RHS repeat-associated protein